METMILLEQPTLYFLFRSGLCDSFNHTVLLLKKLDFPNAKRMCSCVVRQTYLCEKLYPFPRPSVCPCGCGTTSILATDNIDTSRTHLNAAPGDRFNHDGLIVNIFLKFRGVELICGRTTHRNVSFGYATCHPYPLRKLVPAELCCDLFSTRVFVAICLCN